MPVEVGRLHGASVRQIKSPGFRYALPGLRHFRKNSVSMFSCRPQNNIAYRLRLMPTIDRCHVTHPMALEVQRNIRLVTLA